ncbi:MAG: hypothetical protein NT046_08545 [Arenimonas sp.]|nr:hypothetical protein [Arenimonas sp.]
MRAPLPLLIAGLVVSLAACGPKPEATAPEAAAPPAEAAPAAEPAPAPVAAVTAPDGQTYPEAQAGCLDEVAMASATDRAALTVTELNSAESGISVYVQAPGAAGKWFCLANPDGSVQGTEFREEAAAEAEAATDDGVPPLADRFPAAQAACLDAVAAQTNVDRATLTVTEVLWAEAGVGVTITVPGADAPWSCLADEAGKVQGAAYTGSEGAL